MRKGRKPSAAQRRQQARIDQAWHARQLLANSTFHHETVISARMNFAVLNKMPREVARLIDELGPEAPDWANEWFATGAPPLPLYPGDPSGVPEKYRLRNAKRQG